MPTTKKTDGDRLNAIEKKLGALGDRIHNCEKVVRIVGEEFQKNHLSEQVARKWARRANSLSNAMREVNRSLKRYGNEFDKEPHMDDPENDYRWKSDD